MSIHSRPQSCRSRYFSKSVTGPDMSLGELLSFIIDNIVDNLPDASFAKKFFKIHISNIVFVCIETDIRRRCQGTRSIGKVDESFGFQRS